MKKVADISALPENADEDFSHEQQDSVENVLKLVKNGTHLSVANIECSPGSQQGDNYMSIIKRIQVRGKRRLCNGKSKVFDISLIFKRQIVNLQRRKLFRADEAFANEINAYAQLVPVMRRFSQDRLPFPVCHYAGKDTEGDLIVMEDLTCSGFYMVDRRRNLSYRQCRMVLEELASFHAVSLAMKLVKPVQFHTMKEKVTEIVYNDAAAEFYTHSLETSLRGTLDSLHYSNRDGSLDAPIKAIEKLSGRLYQIMSSAVRNSHEPWRVLCHGDTWVNNLMFNEGHDRVKLIDLQTMRYTSPVIDILHLLYTSTGVEIRSTYGDELIRNYQEALVTALRSYVPASKSFVLPALEATFSYENIRAEYDDRILYGLGIAMWLLPAVTFHPDHIPDLDQVTMNDFKTKNHEKTIAQMLSADYHTRMKDTVLEFYRKGFLDSV
ncbi:uncharacterized protein LOC109421739 [Aedes albopictus]|uniref:CHK kinase-like domain-containing protein n=1 Tax=Aedes albopictus TaxID=7160 RepID=A0ABM1ZIN9_AEDAL|nr:uncharacterized protein LOC109425465 [Aedes albopictus]XP_029713959.1 uncharacterized protein LOC109425465 [Aedes albopictus]XP_029713960.1 uncharacterized protein LOC109425465 [Aedes albopictus]